MWENCVLFAWQRHLRTCFSDCIPVAKQCVTVSSVDHFLWFFSCRAWYLSESRTPRSSQVPSNNQCFSLHNIVHVLSTLFPSRFHTYSVVSLASGASSSTLHPIYSVEVLFLQQNIFPKFWCEPTTAFLQFWVIPHRVSHIAQSWRYVQPCLYAIRNILRSTHIKVTLNEPIAKYPTSVCTCS